MISGQRIFQILVFSIAGLMALGGGFFHDEALSDGLTRTVTYTLYKRLPPPPEGPRFCKAVQVGSYGLMRPCDWQPPFVWWLQHRA